MLALDCERIHLSQSGISLKLRPSDLCDFAMRTVSVGFAVSRAPRIFRPQPALNVLVTPRNRPYWGRRVAPLMCAAGPPSSARRAVLALLVAPLLPFRVQAEDLQGIQDLALSYTRAQRFEDAEVLWTKAITLDPKNAAAYSNRGNSRISQARFHDALSDFEKAIQLAPEEPDPFLGRGIALEGLRLYQEAINAYENANKLALKRGREDPVALNNLGNAWGGMGEWARARDFYKRAADLDTRFVFALANEGLASLQIGDDDTGSRIVRTLLRKYPGFADMHAVNAMLLWERGEAAQAENEWYKAVQADAR